MREDETNTDGSPTVNIEIMTNHDQVNGTDNRTEDENLKTLKTTSSLEEDNLKTKSRGKRDEDAMFLGGMDIYLTVLKSIVIDSVFIPLFIVRRLTMRV